MAISLTLGFLHVDFFGLKITMKPSPPEDTPVLEVTIFQGSWPWICWESMGIHQIHRHAKTTILSNEKKGPWLVWLYRGWNSTQFNCSFGRIIWFLVVLFWCFFLEVTIQQPFGIIFVYIVFSSVDPSRKSKDVFFSHTWRTKGSEKILALLFQFGWHIALLLWILVAGITFALVATGVLVSPFKVEISLLSFSDEIAYFPWIAIATAGSFIVSYMILPYVLLFSRPTTCFLDVVCIHQSLGEQHKQFTKPGVPHILVRFISPYSDSSPWSFSGKLHVTHLKVQLLAGFSLRVLYETTFGKKSCNPTKHAKTLLLPMGEWSWPPQTSTRLEFWMWV